jgi:hypothetical protein
LFSVGFSRLLFSSFPVVSAVYVLVWETARGVGRNVMEAAAKIAAGHDVFFSSDAAASGHTWAAALFNREFVQWGARILKDRNQIPEEHGIL